MAKYILFDTETTGNQAEDRIIQVGAMVIDGRGSVEVYDELCSTNVPIKFEAMEVHNITPEMIVGKPKFEDTIFYHDLNGLNRPENYLIAHNINFDLGMLEKEGFDNRMYVIDTLRCSRHLFPDSPYHRLQYFRYSLGLYKDEEREAKKHNIVIKAHDAIGDVLVMRLLLSKLVTEVKRLYPQEHPMQKLVDLTNQPVMIKKFRFGKYNGEEISRVAKIDIQYLKWMYNKLDLDEDMMFTLEKMIERYP